LGEGERGLRGVQLLAGDIALFEQGTHALIVSLCFLKACFRVAHRVLRLQPFLRMFHLLQQAEVLLRVLIGGFRCADSGAGQEGLRLQLALELFDAQLCLTQLETRLLRLYLKGNTGAFGVRLCRFDLRTALLNLLLHLAWIDACQQLSLAHATAFLHIEGGEPSRHARLDFDGAHWLNRARFRYIDHDCATLNRVETLVGVARLGTAFMQRPEHAPSDAKHAEGDSTSDQSPSHRSLLASLYPLTTPMGRKRATLRAMPA